MSCVSKGVESGLSVNPPGVGPIRFPIQPPGRREGTKPHSIWEGRPDGLRDGRAGRGQASEAFGPSRGKGLGPATGLEGEVDHPLSQVGGAEDRYARALVGTLKGR